jgi:hypothetical protein
VQLLERHKRIAAVEIVDAGQPHPPQDGLCLFHRICDLSNGRFGNHIPNQLHRGFQQDAGSIAFIVALDLSVLGMRRS